MFAAQQAEKRRRFSFGLQQMVRPHLIFRSDRHLLVDSFAGEDKVCFVGGSHAERSDERQLLDFKAQDATGEHLLDLSSVRQEQPPWPEFPIAQVDAVGHRTTGALKETPSGVPTVRLRIVREDATGVPPGEEKLFTRRLRSAPVRI